MTEEFFHQLTTSPPPALKRMVATIRFDVEDGPTTRHWLLAVDRGTVRVSHRKAKADAVIRVSRDLFERIFAGETNAMAAVLRGEISIDGDPELLLAFQRLVPGPARSAS
jgi:putative sterol carrier protein